MASLNREIEGMLMAWRRLLVHPATRLWLPVLLWMGVIFYLSSQPSGTYPTFPVWVQKGAHIFEYGVLAALLFRALRDHRVPLRRQALAAWFVSVAYAVTDEVHQLFVPTRRGQPLDVLIDSLGAGVVVLALWALTRYNNRFNL